MWATPPSASDAPGLYCRQTIEDICVDGDLVVAGGCLLTEPGSLAAFWQLAKGLRRALRQRRFIMSRRRATDEALARWFSFQPAAEPLHGEPAPEPAAGILDPDVSLSAL